MFRARKMRLGAMVGLIKSNFREKFKFISYNLSRAAHITFDFFGLSEFFI